MTVQEQVEKARVAQKIYAQFTQEQMDRVVKAVGKAAYDNAEILGTEAYEETKMGILENKIIKMRNTAGVAWECVRGKKALGLIDHDEENGIDTYAKPIGVIAVVTPSTNPTSTPTSNGMYALKSGNAFIVSPHPSAKKCTQHCVNLMRDACVKAGAPADLIQCLEEPGIRASNELMAACDLVCATGGPGMVKAAYSSGTPSFGVGQGNVQTFIAPDYKDYGAAAEMIIYNREYDRGMPCTGDQSLYIPKAALKDVLEAFETRKCFNITDPDTIQKIRELCFINGILNRAIVGQSAASICKMIGVEIPEDTQLLLVQMPEKFEIEDVLNREILCPMVRYHVYEDFKEAIAIGCAKLHREGAGHSSCIFSNEKKYIDYAGQHLPVGRLMVNQPNIAAGGNAFFNGLEPTLTIGCGFWGGNSITENVTYKHFRNFTRVAFRRDDRPPYDITLVTADD